MERRLLVAIALSVLVWVGWSKLFPAAPIKPAKRGTPPAAAVGQDPAAPAASGLPAPGPAPAPAPPDSAQKAEEREFTVALPSGEWLDVGFTTKGAAIRFLRLRTAFEWAPRDATPREPLDLLLPADPRFLTGMIELAKGDADRLRTLAWTLDAQGPDAVVFSFVTNGGLKITKRYALPTAKGRYDLGLSVTVERVSGTPVADEVASVRLLTAAGVAHEPYVATSYGSTPRGVTHVMGSDDEPRLSQGPLSTTDIGPLQYRGLRLCGVATGYFTCSLWSNGGEDSPRFSRTWTELGAHPQTDSSAAEERLGKFFETERNRPPAADLRLAHRLSEVARTPHCAWVEARVPVVATPAAAPGATFRVYAGPLDRGVLASDEGRYEALRELVTYPVAPDALAKALLFLFDLFRGLTGSAGVAVLLMTLAVRGGLMPLSIRNQLSMRRYGRRIAKVKPRLEQLKARFANDPRKFREEQVKLYREHKIGFPSGCLMMFLQFPIFMALFSSLRIEYGLRHEAFLWIRDLSGPDRLVDFGLTKPLSLFNVFPPGGVYALNLLPILYMALSIWQQRMMPKAMDEQQAQQMKMAKWMMILFPILLYNYTAALALYMVASTGVAMVESAIVRRQDARDAA